MFRHFSEKLSEEQILAWADDHYRRTGKWPTTGSGPVLDSPSEDWRAVHAALRGGGGGLPGGSSSALLLAEHRRQRGHKPAAPARVSRLACAAGPCHTGAVC